MDGADVRSLLAVYAKGMCMGTADAVPGVSGGTIALVLGIYDRLVAAISEFSAENVRAIVQGIAGGDDGARADMWAAIDRMDLPFLVALGAGMGSAVLVLTRIVTWADEAHPVAMFALFFGLIAASGVVLFREVTPLSAAEVIASLAGIVLAALASGLSPVGGTSSLPFVFLAGAVALSAMVMPGLSGSLLLVILGQYTHMSARLSAFTDALVDVLQGGSLGPAVEHGTVIAAFLAGGVLGVLTVARVVDRALRRNRSVTIAFLVGLVIGALRAPWRRIHVEVTSWTAGSAGAVLGWILIGAVLVLAIDRYVYRIEV